MIRSMTGYGDARSVEEGVAYTLEIRTLNSRYFKATIKLPEALQFLEGEVEKVLRASLRRGSVSYQLRMKSQSADAAYDLNTAALQRYVDQLGSAKMPEGITGTIDLGAVGTWPGVAQTPDMDDAAKAGHWQSIKKLTDKALEKLVAMRVREGEAIKNDLLTHCETLRSNLSGVAERAPMVIGEYHERLKQRVTTLLANTTVQLEESALAREVAIFAERCDVHEEMARATSHIAQFESCLNQEGDTGRRLDFIAQELLREANTIGSKSNDTTIARHVVELKAAIDRLKEQVQNVE
jgi:uncharacterized protein (TIGR00255 family)